MSFEDARKRWELENNIETVDPDLIYKYDSQEQDDETSKKPWQTDPNYFKHVRISATALIKMVMHARSGGDLEIMGLLQGKIKGNVMIIMDAFALPVEGTETRVNAQGEAYEYMVNYLDLIRQVGRQENALGWYHSHPGYGCWLSGIDVSTQMLNQQYQEPWLAIVVDPKRTISSGKVNLGAFRTYPQDYKPPDEGPTEYQSIPLSKIADFGVHCKRYYPLEVSYFKSSLDAHLLDLLWNKYWINTLSSSSITMNKDYVTGQIVDLTEKIEQASSELKQSGKMRFPSKKQEESQLSKLTKDSKKLSSEQVHGMMSQVIKDVLFNSESCRPDVEMN